MPEFVVNDPAGSMCIVMDGDSEVIPEQFNPWNQENHGNTVEHSYTDTPQNIGYNPSTGLFSINCGRAILHIIPQFIVTRSQSAGNVILTIKRSGTVVYAEGFYVPLQEETIIGNPLSILANAGNTLEFLVSNADNTYMTVVQGTTVTMYKHASGGTPVYST